MIIFKHTNDISNYLFFSEASGKTTGFVPTMGALHSGHISLIEKARVECDVVISSIFVNPTQFNDPADFEKYPISIEKDIDLLEKAGCNVLFIPSVTEMYPEGLAAQKHYELGFIETVLDGAYRPGHFQGVCRVVEKLLHIVHPHQLFLGQKDYQQCMVIRKLVESMGIKTQIVICPTLRDADGLAMSSRNIRLNEEARRKAPLMYQTLSSIRQIIKPGDLSELKKQAIDHLTAGGFTVDYIEIADATTLSLIQYWDGHTALVVMVAAFINNVRLIDNLIL
ncbi:MAG: pantoate--beta-alanine ligase [Chitinophagaceae bacterium]|nr:pantoate--beta-alanine ligase [Chitinophagaceae bacterium]